MNRQDLQRRVATLAREHLAAGDPTGWFEPLYQAAGDDITAIPWADMRPHPALSAWLARRAPGDGARAVVVGCGMGDDAEAVAAAGWKVTAFDLAPTSLAWCRRRFPRSQVRYERADLLALPARWRGAFALVVEIYTVQALPPELHPPALAAVASLVAPGGRLLLVCRGRDDDEEPVGPPWALSRAELRTLKPLGLAHRSFRELDEGDGIRRFVAERARPHAAR